MVLWPQVRETSRRVFGRSGPNTVKAEKSLDAVKRDFSDIVLPAQLQERVRALAAVTANTRRHGAPFRHMMFYGANARPRACSRCNSSIDSRHGKAVGSCLHRQTLSCRQQRSGTWTTPGILLHL